MSKYYSKTKAFNLLLNYWSKHRPISEEHALWLKENCTAHIVKSEQILYVEGDRQKKIYFVSEGILARRKLTPQKKKQQLLAIAPPNYGLFTTKHTHSLTPAEGDIVALRSSLLVSIPYTSLALEGFKHLGLDEFSKQLVNKKKAMLDKLRPLAFERDAMQRYLRFARDLPELCSILWQQEQADLIDVSISTVQRGFSRL